MDLETIMPGRCRMYHAGKGDNALDRPRQVGDDKADARVQLVRCHSTLATTAAACSSSAPDSGSWRSNAVPRGVVARPGA